MSLFGPLLGLAGTLIGVKADSDARRRSDYMNSPQGIRANAEKAGFNPLVFAGPGVGIGAQYAPTMGSTIANGFAAAGSMYNDAQALDIQRAELELERQRVEELVKKTTLQPNVPGVYQRGKPAEQPAKSNSNGDGGFRDGNPASRLGGDDPESDTTRIGGGWWKTNPFYSDAAVIENRYGELADWASGAITIPADAVWTGLYWGDYYLNNGEAMKQFYNDYKAPKKAKAKVKKPTTLNRYPALTRTGSYGRDFFQDN